jgi:hypothetical protein
MGIRIPITTNNLRFHAQEEEGATHGVVVDAARSRGRNAGRLFVEMLQRVWRSEVD